MKYDDIEQLLHQYGDDQRQQQKAVEHVRLLAHRQARRGTALLCTLVALTIAGVVLYRVQPPKPSAAIALRQPAATAPAIPAVTATPSPSGHPPLRVSHPQHTIPNDLQITATDTVPSSEIPTTFLAQNTIPTTPSDIQYADTLPSPPIVITPSTDTRTCVVSAEPPRIEPFETHTHRHNPNHPNSTDRNTDCQRTYAKLRMTAAIGAATMGSGLLALAEKEDASFQMANEVDASYSRITPTSMLQAEVGMTYTVAANDRRHLNVGLGISGYSHQGDYHTHDISYIHPEDGTSGFCTDSPGQIPIVTDTKYSLSTLSLYVSLPLTLDLYPRGREKAGWQISITPAHNIVTSGNNALGAIHYNRITLNPWKLTLGIGFAIPSDIVRDISLTANILPVYSHGSFHEFGIRIGF